MQTHLAEHLPKTNRIKLGGYYTPEALVREVHGFITPYLRDKKKEVVILDSAGGCGAFLFGFQQHDYRVADCDLAACEYLCSHFNKQNVFNTNSLKAVDRVKYRISETAFLISIGNPPYNDTTSEFKNGKKGRNICDVDLYDRDLGVSFLKSYYKLKSDIVCVLHPLSYLIKESNFNRLRDFKDNYKLIKGVVFSSALFHGTGTGKFPILIALYEKNSTGMTRKYIEHFQFDVLGETKKFVFSEYETTDGYINKYPPRKNDVKESPLGLYYYTFRDFNSLKKNASFMTEKRPNSIVVTLENFYKYAYLYALKKLFNPENAWLYGNLSPLVRVTELEKNQKYYVEYALKTSNVFVKNNDSNIKTIADFYKIKLGSGDDVQNVEKKITSLLSKLV